jgi:hypothetical protein
MALGALGIGAILSGASTLFQGIVGGVQAAKGNKGFKKTMANRPTYNIPKEYQDILAKYQQTYSGNKPGFEQQLDQVGQLGARTRGAAERGAISSNAYGAQVGDIYQKELDAIQKEYINNAEFKLAGVDKIAGAQQLLAGQKDAKQNWDTLMPYQTELNRFGEMKKTGIENIFGAIQGGIGNVTDLLGTKYYSDALKGLQGNKT